MSPVADRPDPSPLEQAVMNHLRANGRASVDLKLDAVWLAEISKDPNALIWRMARRGFLHRIQTGRYVISRGRNSAPVFDTVEWFPGVVLDRLDMAHYVS